MSSTIGLRPADEGRAHEGRFLPALSSDSRSTSGLTHRWSALGATVFVVSSGRPGRQCSSHPRWIAGSPGRIGAVAVCALVCVACGSKQSVDSGGFTAAQRTVAQTALDRLQGTAIPTRVVAISLQTRQAPRICSLVPQLDAPGTFNPWWPGSQVVPAPSSCRRACSRPRSARRPGTIGFRSRPLAAMSRSHRGSRQRSCAQWNRNRPRSARFSRMATCSSYRANEPLFASQAAR